MPRLFWKLFLALWLSIMAFAVVVSWINQTVYMRNAVGEPRVLFELNLNRSKAKLATDMREGGERRVRRSLRKLPHGMRNHVFVMDSQGKELIGRERSLKTLKKRRIKISSEIIKNAQGQEYTLVSASKIPPRVLLAPGSVGVWTRLGVAAVISALISLLLARYLAAPLGQLSRASRSLATGDLSVRVGSPLDQRKDEFGQLALDLDEMIGRLQVSQVANQRLLRDVSHELRSPLARLRVALEIARNKDKSLLADELNRIELESERLEKLVDEVLGLLRESSEVDELNLQTFDLTELLQDLVETVNYEIGDDHEKIELHSEPSLMLKADRELLWRVFENLLRNALIHSGGVEGVQITVLPVLGDEVEIRVLDQGPGIPPEHIEHIFEPFYRVDEARNRGSGGHGLGLAIAASAVRRHGGRILAVNRQTGGLEVCVHLPLKPA